MAKFQVIGADRETGEDVQLIVEAVSAEEASAKANRRGMFVTDCVQAASAQRFAVSAPTIRPVTAKSPLFRAGKFLAVLLAAITVTCVIVWLAWLRPQNNEINKTLADAKAASAKSAEREEKIAADYRRRAEEAGQKAKALEAANAAEEERKRQTATLSGEVWIQKTNGDTLSLATEDVLLLPLNVEVGGTKSDIRRFVSELETAVQVALELPDNSSAKASARAAKAVLDPIQPFLKAQQMPTPNAVAASLGISEFRIRDYLINKALAAVSRNNLSPIRLEQKLAADEFWQLLSAQTLASSTTGRDGKFAFKDVPSGKYMLACRVCRPALQGVVYWAKMIDTSAGGDITLDFTQTNATILTY